MDDLLVSLDDYRELATFLEGKIADAGANGLDEVDELRARLASLREMLSNPDRIREHAEQPGRDRLETAVFDLKMKRAQPQGGPLEDLERDVVQDLGNDVLRRRYIEEAEATGAQLRAAETLSRALLGATRPDVKERVGFDVALLYLGEGELPHARNAFLDVVRAGAAGPLALSAARRLLNLQVDTSDPDVVGPARELIAKADPDAEARRDAADGILSLHTTTPQPDTRLAVAYRALVGSPRSDEAIQWLRRFYANQGEHVVTLAVVGTLAVVTGVWFFYRTGLVRVGHRFIQTTMVASLGLLAVMIVSILTGWGASGLGGVVIFGILYLFIAVMNLFVDYDFAYRAPASQLSADAEWYSAFSLLLSSAMVYLALLRIFGGRR